MSYNVVPQKPIDLLYKNIHGKPYITVSSKGISNGLSTIPNDGADFGPDTMLGATAPNQYGPPYTKTVGIQEAINYIYSKGGGKIVLGTGTYTLSSIQSGINAYGGIIIPNSSTIIPITIEGEVTYLGQYQLSNGYVQPTSNPGVLIDGSQLVGTSSTPNAGVIAADWSSNDASLLPPAGPSLTSVRMATWAYICQGVLIWECQYSRKPM